MNAAGVPYLRWSIAAIVFLFACENYTPQPVSAPNTHFKNAVIIDCKEQCDEISATIQSRGGIVTQNYKNVPLISADVDSTTLRDINRLLGGRAVTKDILVKAPQPVERLSLSTHQIQGLTVDENTIKAATGDLIRPANYSYNNSLTGAAEAHLQGFRGKDVIVAVIDTGTANNPDIVPVLRNTVIGGESFVDGADEPSATSILNEEHGTWIAGMIAAHGGIITTPDSELAQAVTAYAPEGVVPIDAETTVIPMFGTAPDAKVYAMKTFAAGGGGAPSSIVLAAMDRAITLKTNFNQGIPSEPVSGDGTEDNPFVYDSLDIKVVNMSLGGATLFAANEIDDKVTELMLDAGIVVVTSAGNEGFAAMTGASPGTGLGSIAVGAANPPKHERILRELQNGPGTGIQFRPTDHIQMATFSSRGPTADGRPGVDIVANGFASFVQGADGHVSMVSGTSLSAPTIAGAAALLVGAFPELSAQEIRTALVKGANPTVIGGRPTMNDQGFGFLNITGAFDVIAAGNLEPILPKEAYAEVNMAVREILQDNGYPVIRFNRRNSYSTRITLGPGEVQQLFLEVGTNIHDIDIAVENVTPELPPAQQNVMFGDDLMVTFVDSPTSIDRTRFREFITTNTDLNVSHPQPGIARLAMMGDWTNIGLISADIRVTLNTGTKSPPIAAGTLIDEQVDTYTFTVTPEMTTIAFDLSWAADWSFYPTHDLDLIINGPNEELILDGATLSAPEEVVIESPAPGEWTLMIEGFMLHEMADDYILRGTDQTENNILVTPIAPPPPEPTPTEPPVPQP